MANTIEVLIKARDEASRQLKDVEKQLGGLASPVGLATKAFAALGGAMALGSIIKSTIAAAADEERQWNRVTAALRNHQMSVEANLPIIKRMTDSLEWQTGQADELITQGFNRLIAANFSLAESYNVMRAAANLAAGAQMDINTATVLLIKAKQGNIETLARYGLQIDETIPKSEKFAAVLKAINDQFGGQAAANMDGYAGGMGRLAIAWERIQEAVGSPAIQKLGEILEELTLGLGDPDSANMTGGLRELQAELARVEGDLDQYRKMVEINVIEGNELLVAHYGNVVTQLTLERNKLIALVEKHPSSRIPPPDFRDWDDGITQAKLRLKDLYSPDTLATIGGLPSLNDILGMSDDPSAQEDAAMSARGRAFIAMRDEEMRRQAAATASEAAAEREREAIDRLVPSIQNVLSPLAEWAAYGGEIGDAFEDMGRRLIETVLNQIMAAIAEAIAQAIILKTTLQSTQAGAGAGALGFLGPIGVIGGFLASLSPIFDDQDNDRRLANESKRMGRIITEGFRDGATQSTSPIMTAGRSDGGGGTTIVNNFYGITAGEFVSEEVFPRLSVASKRRQVSLKASTKNRFGGSLVFS